ncbi:hypothetical protein TSUD_26110 [Trifolium subterraneum]|uniref:Uncharacterized protein n=1 Tax=Trifolium subterraneum TaxID=3900 RepID=A0A2Z6NCB0_TRISU|nr:hypothetical protein TSUD_26110 [Trifolium subterraneum]
MKNPGSNTKGDKDLGSRFQALSAEITDDDTRVHAVNEPFENVDDMAVQQEKSDVNPRITKGKPQYGTKVSGTPVENGGRYTREHKLATRDNTGGTSRRGSSNLNDLFQKKAYSGFISAHITQNNETIIIEQTEHTTSNNNEQGRRSSTADMTHKITSTQVQAGLEEGEWPNALRPPDVTLKPIEPHRPEGIDVADFNPEGEEFEDAQDKGVLSTDDSDMEIVSETPPSTKH